MQHEGRGAAPEKCCIMGQGDEGKKKADKASYRFLVHEGHSMCNSQHLSNALSKANKQIQLFSVRMAITSITTAFLVLLSSLFKANDTLGPIHLVSLIQHVLPCVSCASLFESPFRSKQTPQPQSVHHLTQQPVHKHHPASNVSLALLLLTIFISFNVSLLGYASKDVTLDPTG